MLFLKWQTFPCWSFINQPTPFFGAWQSTRGRPLFGIGEVWRNRLPSMRKTDCSNHTGGTSFTKDSQPSSPATRRFFIALEPGRHQILLELRAVRHSVLIHSPEAHQNLSGSTPNRCSGGHQKGCDLEGVKGAAPPITPSKP